MFSFFKKPVDKSQSGAGSRAGLAVFRFANQLAQQLEDVTGRFSALSALADENRRHADAQLGLVKGMEDEAARAQIKFQQFDAIVARSRHLEGILAHAGSILSQVEESTQALLHIGFNIRLIALNALIESAHVGELGKGFAVVAGEINNLSHRIDEVSKKVLADATSARQDLEAQRSDVSSIVHEVGQTLESALGLLDTFSASLRTMSASSHQVVATSEKQHSRLDDEMRAMQDRIEGISKMAAELIGEISGTRVQEVSPQQVSSLPAGTIIVDVRQPDEFRGELRHIAGAKLVTIDENFAAKIHDMDRDCPTLFVCRSGGRSSRAAQIAQACGFRTVMNLTGGMLRWNELRLPVE